MSTSERPASNWRTHPASPLIVCAFAYGLAIAAALVTIDIYANPSPLWSALAGDIAATIVIFLVGWALSNSSVYDPYWSAAPAILMIYWIVHPIGNEAITVREVIVFLIVAVYGARLTFNCFRRWQDMTEQDFRYQDLKARFGILYPLVDLFGIQMMPTLMVFANCLAVYAVTQQDTPLGTLDLLAIVITSGSVLIETVADEQLRAFRLSPDAATGVCKKGLWAWSQHPNYFGELGFWWGLWIFAMAVDTAWWWTIGGPIAMTILFVAASLPMMLKRKRERRADYDEQVKGIPVLIPWPPKWRR